MIPERKRIFILVKTYPTISKQYAELVCTAGILEDGSWIRLYPIPFRLLENEQKYKKYTWISVDVVRNTSDFRIESYRPDIESIKLEPEIKKKKGRVDWEARKRIIFHNQKIYTNLEELIREAKINYKSLAVFKPNQIKDIIVEKRDNEWKKETLDALTAQIKQLDLFKTEEELEAELTPAKKIPYAFRYKFTDDVGAEASLMIEDWEIGMLYLNCLERRQSEELAIQDVKNKYFENFAKTKDIYFFMGTTKTWHNVSPNPFLIIGVFYPPFEKINE